MFEWNKGKNDSRLIMLTNSTFCEDMGINEPYLQEDCGDGLSIIQFLNTKKLEDEEACEYCHNMLGNKILMIWKYMDNSWRIIWIKDVLNKKEQRVVWERFWEHML